jgi:tRNA(fMet)-specific endonuclease VapC
MTYLLDTNILSEPLKKTPSDLVLSLLKKNETQIALCTPVWHELNYGMNRLPESRKKERIQDYFFYVIKEALPIISYDCFAAEIHSRIRAEQDASGKKTPYIDSQIASIAIANNLILVSRNTTDFEQFKGLMLENWFE